MPMLGKRKRVEEPASEEDVEDFEDSDVEAQLAGSVASSSGKGEEKEEGTFSKEFINNIKGLQRAITDISTDLDWVERLEVVSAEPFTADVHDDLKTELAL